MSTVSTRKAMNAIQYTPGPWATDGTNVFHQVNPGGQKSLIAMVSREPGIEQAKANARLIAAVPFLLAALQDVVEAYGCECLPSETKGHCPMCLGRAALALAGGSALIEREAIRLPPAVRGQVVVCRHRGATNAVVRERGRQ